MKRQIICSDCAKKHPAQEYAGEWIKRVYGTAKSSTWVCDLCAFKIPKNALCVAESFGTNQQPYIAWEDDYIERR